MRKQHFQGSLVLLFANFESSLGESKWDDIAFFIHLCTQFFRSVSYVSVIQLNSAIHCCVF